jgi:hypothetical protein
LGKGCCREELISSFESEVIVVILGEKEKNLPEYYQKVLCLIPEGSDKPITVSEISKITGYRGQLVRDIVSKLIVTYGYRIGTSNIKHQSGYYMITNAVEQEATVRNLRSRAFKILKRAKAIENGPDPNQEELKI